MDVCKSTVQGYGDWIVRSGKSVRNANDSQRKEGDRDLTEFEKVSSETMNDPDDGNLKENCIYWLNNDKVATVNFCQGRYVSKIKKLAEKYPDRVKIQSESKDVLVATVPVSAVQITIRELNLTDEQREAMSERARRNFRST